LKKKVLAERAAKRKQEEEERKRIEEEEKREAGTLICATKLPKSSKLNMLQFRYRTSRG
jgi:hypothetical protein